MGDRRATTPGMRVGTTRGGADTRARGTDDIAGVGDRQGPWIFNCLYTAQKMKKKKSWKDGVCVCDQMTGFLRVRLFDAESGVHSTLLKARRSEEALDTTELPLRPVDQLLDDEIELPLHLVQVQGFAVESPEAQEQLHEIDLKQKWPEILHPQQKQYKPFEQQKMHLRKTTLSSCEPLFALKATQETGKPPIGGITFARTAPVLASAANISRSAAASSVSNESSTAPSSVDNERTFLSARPRSGNSIPETTQFGPFRRIVHDCHTRRTAADTPPSGVSADACGQAYETQKTPHSLESSLRREVRSIMSDTQSRRAAATQVVLRTSPSLFWQNHSTRNTCVPDKDVTLQLGAEVRKEALAATAYPKWTGSRERMMFSRLFESSAGCL